MMRADFTVSGAHLAASRLFATQEALKLVPPPNRSPQDLNRHIRQALGLQLPQVWRAA